MPTPPKPARYDDGCLAAFEEWRKDVRTQPPRPRLAPSNRPPYDALRRAFAHVPRPMQVQGDPCGTEAPAEQVEWLLNAKDDELTCEHFRGYTGYVGSTTGGCDDLRYLLPSLLRIWREELFQKESWFTQYFHDDLIRGEFLQQALDDKLRRAVAEFMRTSLLERLAAEAETRIVGSSRTYNWFGQFAAYGVFADDIPLLWEAWWAMAVPGHAVSAVQYASCLVCGEEDNPVFAAPVTREAAGGPPSLWSSDTYSNTNTWRPANVEFLSRTLTVEYLRDRLSHARAAFGDWRLAAAECPTAILLGILDKRHDLVAARCRALPKTLELGNRWPPTFDQAVAAFGGD